MIAAGAGRLKAAIPVDFDFLHPDYTAVYRHRAQFLQRIRETGSASKLCTFYRHNPIQFIIDWAVTFDPRNVEIGLPSKIPFIPFPRQIEWLEWALERWRARERGLTEKSRGEGVSWLAVSLATTLCLFNEGIVVGFGSRKQEYVDQLGDPKSLFFKARMFLEALPPEFRRGWNAKDCAREMRILFPATGSAMTGEAGDSIGRGDRTSIFFVDEAAFLEHPEVAEASLSDTTNCRIDISTPPLIADDNAFVERRHALPKRQVFTLHYRDDPRRDEKWEAAKRRDIAPHIFEAEYNCSYERGGAFFDTNKLLVPKLDELGQAVRNDRGEPVFVPVSDPHHPTYVFAVVDTGAKAGREHDGVGVAYFAADKHAVNPHPLYILDWDYTQIQGASLEVWLPSVFSMLEYYARELQALEGSEGAHIEDAAAGIVLLQQGQNHGWPVTPIDSKLVQLGKTGRCLNISSYVHQGLVKMTERAYLKTVDFKGVTKNHMLSQVKSFSPAVKESSTRQDDLQDCFAYGIAKALGNYEGF